MSPVKKRRRMPTVINRGLGLLEVILPQGASENIESILPPGARDNSGFWLPRGCEGAGDLFSPARRKQQQNQRRIQRRRVRSAPPQETSARRAAEAGGSNGLTEPPDHQPDNSPRRDVPSVYAAPTRQDHPHRSVKSGRR